MYLIVVTTIYIYIYIITELATSWQLPLPYIYLLLISNKYNNNNNRGDARLSIFVAHHSLHSPYLLRSPPSRNYGESAMKSIGYPKTLPQAPQRRNYRVGESLNINSSLEVAARSHFVLSESHPLFLSLVQTRALLNMENSGADAASLQVTIPLSRKDEGVIYFISPLFVFTLRCTQHF